MDRVTHSADPVRPLPGENPSTRKQALACALAMLAAAFVYLNALDNPFVYDDARVIVENRSLLDLSNWRFVLLHDLSRPLVNLSYAVDYAIWGSGPFGFHVTNLLLHVANVGLLFFVVLRLAADGRATSMVQVSEWPVIAFVSASVFAVHPMMTEAVGYVSGRSELLCATFFLLALLSARAWIVRGGGAGWLLGAVGCWMLALASKEVAALFPVVVFWYERFFFAGTPGERRRRVWRLHAPLFGLAVLAAATRIAAFALIEHSEGVQIFWHYGLVELDVVKRYLVLLLFPSGQAIFHEVSAINSVFEWRALPGILVVGGLVAAAWGLRRRSPMVSFGVLWFLLLLVPSSVLVMLDRGEPMAEHRIYLASCGFFIAAGRLLGSLAAHVRTRQTQLVLRLSLGVLLVALAASTVVRNDVWGDPVTLWSDASAKAPDAWLPHLLLGEALHNANRHIEAIASYRTLIRLRPEGEVGYARLGVCLTETGRPNEAADAFRELLRRDPTSAEAQNGLGAIALMAGRHEEARRQFRLTLAMHPQNVEARWGLAMLAESVDDDPAEALRLCQEIAVLAPLTPGHEDCIARNRARSDGGG